MTADSTPTCRYLIHTVGLDGPMVAQPTLFTRRARSESSPDMPTGPCIRGSAEAVTLAASFSELEARILMKLLQEESLHGFYPIVPILVSTDAEVQQHLNRVVTESPWIEVDLEGMNGDGRFTAAGSSLEKGLLHESLHALHEEYEGSFYLDCAATTRLREDLQAPSSE
jgi:hypothetical protein